MERLGERLNTARRALDSLQELPFEKTQSDDVVRDAAIQRSEYAVEAIWKAAQVYLREREGLVIGSPKGVIRSCFRVGLFGRGPNQASLRNGGRPKPDRAHLQRGLGSGYCQPRP